MTERIGVHDAPFIFFRVRVFGLNSGCEMSAHNFEGLIGKADADEAWQPENSIVSEGDALGDHHNEPIMVLDDGYLGQGMMEAVGMSWESVHTTVATSTIAMS